MGAVARYAYFNTWVSLMASRLLADERLAALIDAPEEEVREILKMRGLVPAGAEAASAPVDLEHRMTPALLEELKLLGRGLSGRDRDFLMYWAHRYELSGLKSIIRGKARGESAVNLRAHLVDLGTYGTLPLEELLGAEDINELLRSLEKSPGYADMARYARHIFEERGELFALDAAVDRNYYAGLVEQAHSVRGEDARHLQLLVGSLIDRINLIWLLRYRYTYHLSPAEAYYLLIPATYRLKSRQLLALAELRSLEEVKEKLPAPFADLLRHTSSISEMTERLRRWTWQLAEDVLRRTLFNLARGFAYLLLRDRELRHLRAVLWGRKLSLEPRLIRLAMGLEIDWEPSSREATHA